MVKMADGLISSHSVYTTGKQDFMKTRLFSDFPLSSSITEHDNQPIQKPPVPSWKEELLKSAVPDPKLSLTPERSAKASPILPKYMSKTESTKSCTKSRLKQRVRFELDEDENLESYDGSTISDTGVTSTCNSNIEVKTNCFTSPSKTTPQKEYCPKMYSSKPAQHLFDNKDLDVTQTEDETISEHNNSRPASLEYSETQSVLKFLTIRDSEQIKIDPPKIVDSVPAHARKCHAVKNVIVTREFENRHNDSNGYQFPFIDHTARAEPEHVFARPEFNSSLKISEELKDLKAAKPKVSQTLKEKLKQSEETRTEINEKASVKVNQSRDVFAGLVQVEPDINSLCLEVERDIIQKPRAKVNKNVKGCTMKKADGSTFEPKIPDLLEFYTENRQREIPDLHLTGIHLPEVRLYSSDLITAFDIYRHNRVWDTLNM